MKKDLWFCLMQFILYIINMKIVQKMRFMFIIYSISYIEWDYRFFFMKINVENYLVGDGYG